MVRFLLALLIAKMAFASVESIDSECRIQAKETAITTYQTCVKQSRAQKIDEIRKEYQSKLQELKSYYDGEMKKMSLNQKAQLNDAKSEDATIVIKKKAKASAKASAKLSGLPAKKTPGKSLPVRNTEPEMAPQHENSTHLPAPESSDAAEIVNIDDGAI